MEFTATDAAVVLVWFRNDLRADFNECVEWANKKGAQVKYVFCFDRRLFFAQTSFNTVKCGKLRLDYYREAVKEL